MSLFVFHPSWPVKRFNEVLQIRKGSIDPRNTPAEEFELFSIPAFDAGNGPERQSGKDIGSSKTVVEEKDCLFSKLNPRIPRTWIIPKSNGIRQICSTEFWPVRSRYAEGHKNYLDPHFLKWLFRFETFLNEFRGNVSGGVQSRQRLKQNDLLEIQVPIPPVDEQLWIVAQIEELTRRAEEARKLRRDAVERAKRLFQGELERIFLPIETDDWTEYDACEVFDIVKGQVDPCEEPYASMLHVAPDVMEAGTGRLFLDKIRTAKELELKSGKYLFDTSHVLYSKIRPNLRKVALPDFSGTCSADMYPLIPNTEVVNREFLALVLLSPPFTAYAAENSDRNAMPKVNRPTMFGYRVKLPEKSEQEEIVSRIRTMQDKAEEITKLQNKVDEDLAKFQSALLAKAFRGEL